MTKEPPLSFASVTAASKARREAGEKSVACTMRRKRFTPIAPCAGRRPCGAVGARRVPASELGDDILPGIDRAPASRREPQRP
jgi:hypothetical protein